MFLGKEKRGGDEKMERGPSHAVLLGEMKKEKRGGVLASLEKRGETG